PSSAPCSLHLLDAPPIVGAASWGCATPICERMHEDFRDACLVSSIRQRDHVRVVAVHAAVGNESEKMKPMASRFDEGFLQYLITSELARGDGLVNPSQVLRNNSAGAQVEVADLRVAHLPSGHANVSSAGA